RGGRKEAGGGRRRQFHRPGPAARHTVMTGHVFFPTCVDLVTAYIACRRAPPFFYSGMQMSYIDAATAPMRKTGHVKIHGPEAFAGMRKAGQLAAECLDMLVPEVRAGVTTDHID